MRCSTGQCVAFVGVYLAGSFTNRLGYRWTLLGMLLMNAMIFVSFSISAIILWLIYLTSQANSLALLVVSQALEGVSWGFFHRQPLAYASDIVSLPLRAACTATLQMSQSIGSIIVAGVTFGRNGLRNEWSWRVPLALQWIFPTLS